MKPFKESFILTGSDCERVDALLAKRYSDYSRNYFQQLIEEQHVLINGKPLKKRYKPFTGDRIDIFFKQRPGPDLTPETIPLDIIYEDAHLLVINKPAGMVVHPAPGNWSRTFVNALLAYTPIENESPDRPGIVHRLDKETSGLLIATKTYRAHTALSRMFAERLITKEYLAITTGKAPPGEIRLPIKRCPFHRKKMIASPEGKEASTAIELLSFNGTFSKVRAFPKTGRTHQIRVHLQAVGTPILGDKLYGIESVNRNYKTDRHFLHAEKLRFIHPFSGKELSLYAPLPKDMEEIFLCGF